MGSFVTTVWKYLWLDKVAARFSPKQIVETKKESEFTTCTFTFSFPAFSQLQEGERCTSTKACVGDFAFALQMYPGGYTSAKPGYVSCFLFNESEKVMSCNVKLELMAGDKAVLIVSFVWSFEAHRAYGWFDFVQKSYILDPANGVLKGDCLQIRATVTVTLPAPELLPATCVKDSSDSYVYKEGPGTAQLDLLGMHEDGAGHDFNIIVCTREGNGTTSSRNSSIPVHKLILAARSPVFYAMLSSGMKESCADEMEITGYAEEAVRAFVRFLYCDSCTEAALEEHGWELLGMADQYDVPALRFVCETYLARKLAKATAITTLQRADMLSAPVLKRKALEYIAQNKKAVSENPALLRELSADLLSEVVLAQAK